MTLRRLHTSMLILGLIFFAGCGGGGGGGDVFTPPADNDQLLTSAAIGTAGGTIAAENLAVTVPSGSFASDRELKIYKSGDDDPFGGTAVSPVYKLDGLPATFSQPLQVSFPLAGKSENTLVAMGETSFVNSGNEMFTGYRLLDVSYTDSTVVAVIPAAPDVVDDGGQGVAVHLVNLAGYTGKSGGTAPGLKVTSTTHFRIVHTGQDAEVANLGTYLENAYNTLASWGFVYTARTSWPVQVFILDLDKERFGEFVPSMWGDNHGYLNFNAQRLDETDDLKVTAGHEFFHLVQALYDKRNRFNKSKFASDRYWLDEACSVWSERTWMGDPDYLSTKARDGHQRLPFHHFHVPSNGDHPDYHGYGMSAFIQYMVNRAGPTSLGAVYDYILAHGNDPVAAIEDVMAGRLHEEFSQYHPLFARDLIHGDLYSDVNVSIAVSYDTDTWDIKTASDNAKTFDFDYAAGASRFFILNLENPDFSADAVLTLETEDGEGTIEVFKFHGSSSTLLGMGHGVNIEHLDQLHDDGQHLLVMVVNSFLGPHYDLDTNITLYANIQEHPVFRLGKIWINGLGTMNVHETNSTGLDTTYTIENYTCQFDGSLFLQPVAGSSAGTTFTAYYDSLVIPENLHKTGTISISVDDADNPTEVTSFTLDATEVNPYTGEVSDIKTYNITGFGIPTLYGPGDDNTFRISDASAASHIDHAEYEEVNYWIGAKTYTLTDLNADFIEIRLIR